MFTQRHSSLSSKKEAHSIPFYRFYLKANGNEQQPLKSRQGERKTTNCGWPSLQFAPVSKFHPLRNHQHIESRLFCPSTTNSCPFCEFHVLPLTSHLLVSTTFITYSPYTYYLHHREDIRTILHVYGLDLLHQIFTIIEVRCIKKCDQLGNRRADQGPPPPPRMCDQLDGVVATARNRGLMPPMFRGKFTNRVLMYV